MADQDAVAGLDAADLLHVCERAVRHVPGLDGVPGALWAVEGAHPEPVLIYMYFFLGMPWGGGCRSTQPEHLVLIEGQE